MAHVFQTILSVDVKEKAIATLISMLKMVHSAPLLIIDATGTSNRLPSKAFAQSITHSTRIVFLNETDLNLRIKNADLSYGIWFVEPPPVIPALSQRTWLSAATGSIFETMEGRVTYESSAGDIFIRWTNPSIGFNDYEVRIPRGYEFTSKGGSGYEATFTIVLRKIS